VIDDRGDKLGLSLHIGFDIISTMPSECSFHLRILSAIIGMTAEVVSQHEVISQRRGRLPAIFGISMARTVTPTMANIPQ